MNQSNYTADIDEELALPEGQPDNTNDTTGTATAPRTQKANLHELLKALTSSILRLEKQQMESSKHSKEMEAKTNEEIVQLRNELGEISNRLNALDLGQSASENEKREIKRQVQQLYVQQEDLRRQTMNTDESLVQIKSAIEKISKIVEIVSKKRATPVSNLDELRQHTSPPPARDNQISRNDAPLGYPPYSIEHKKSCWYLLLPIFLAGVSGLVAIYFWSLTSVLISFIITFVSVRVAFYVTRTAHKAAIGYQELRFSRGTPLAMIASYVCLIIAYIVAILQVVSTVMELANGGTDRIRYLPGECCKWGLLMFPAGFSLFYFLSACCMHTHTEWSRMESLGLARAR